MHKTNANSGRDGMIKCPLKNMHVILANSYIYIIDPSSIFVVANYYFTLAIFVFKP